MNLRYRILGTTALIVLLGLAPLAQAALDTPSLSLGMSGHGKQALTVTAGPSGLPDGFTLWWMDAAQFAAGGGVWPTDVVADQGYAMFTGAPTLNTFGGTQTTFKLAPNQSIVIEVGDLTDETGVAGELGELDYGMTYHFVAFARDADGNAASGLSVTVTDNTTTSTNCTYTWGYWKNHEELWPAFALTLGSVAYTQAELLQIFDEPVAGNGLISLAHQLIAAKLNIIAGANPGAAAATIAAADAQIGSLVIPPIGSGYIHPSLTSSKTQSLDDYNNGLTGPGHCATVPVNQTTWGMVKGLYR